MDETQKRKISAKEFIQKNRTIGFVVLAIFISLFAIYFASIYFYGNTNNIDNLNLENAQPENSGFFENLLPTFSQGDTASSTGLDDDFLSNFTTGGNNINNNEDEDGGGSENDTTRIIKIESKPVLNYVSYDKPISIKNYIEDKPKICSQKLEVVLVRDTESVSVNTLQNTLRSVTGYEDTPETGVLDNNTREKLYQFQNKYKEILYKNKTDKTPTRVIDKETTHFLNLLCGFDIENADDFVQVPTLRYVTSQDKQIYDYNTESKEKTKIESRVATGTNEVIMSAKGEFLVFRTDKTGVLESEFFVARTKSNIKLEKNISTLDFNEKNILVYGVPGYDGLSIKTYDERKNVVKNVAQIPLNEWTLFWIDNDNIGIYNKPTGTADGIYMSLNINTKKLTQLAGPLRGLSVQGTNKSDYSIISSGGQGVIKSYLLNNKTRALGELGVNTFAEKCSKTIFASAIFCALPKSISNNEMYPDDWYKGKTKFNDVIMYKSTNSTTTKIISYLEDKPLSVINIQLNKNGIFFMDENQFGLYVLEP